MQPLNTEAYNLLLNANPNVTLHELGKEGWYEFTYPLFTDASLNTINDLWKIVAYTYSWMPTIPEIKHYLVKDPEALIGQLQALKSGDVSQLPDLFKQLIPVINNSLVGVSKVLHFIAPDVVPIIDRNVLNAWNNFFFIMHREQYDVPKLPRFTTALNIKHLSHYFNYRQTMLQWVANCEGTVNLRELETALFELGKNVTEPQRVYC